MGFNNNIKADLLDLGAGFVDWTAPVVGGLALGIPTAIATKSPILTPFAYSAGSVAAQGLVDETTHNMRNKAKDIRLEDSSDEFKRYLQHSNPDRLPSEFDDKQSVINMGISGALDFALGQGGKLIRSGVTNISKALPEDNFIKKLTRFAGYDKPKSVEGRHLLNPDIDKSKLNPNDINQARRNVISRNIKDIDDNLLNNLNDDEILHLSTLSDTELTSALRNLNIRDKGFVGHNVDNTELSNRIKQVKPEDVVSEYSNITGEDVSQLYRPTVRNTMLKPSSTYLLGYNTSEDGVVDVKVPGTNVSILPLDKLNVGLSMGNTVKQFVNDSNIFNELINNEHYRNQIKDEVNKTMHDLGFEGFTVSEDQIDDYINRARFGHFTKSAFDGVLNFVTAALIQDKMLNTPLSAGKVKRVGGSGLGNIAKHGGAIYAVDRVVRPGTDYLFQSMQGTPSKSQFETLRNTYQDDIIPAMSDHVLGVKSGTKSMNNRVQELTNKVNEVALDDINDINNAFDAFKQQYDNLMYIGNESDADKLKSKFMDYIERKINSKNLTVKHTEEDEIKRVQREIDKILGIDSDDEVVTSKGINKQDLINEIKGRADNITPPQYDVPVVMDEDEIKRVQREIDKILGID